MRFQILFVDEKIDFSDVFDEFVLLAPDSTYSLGCRLHHSVDISDAKLEGVYRKKEGRICARLALKKFGVFSLVVHRAIKPPVFPAEFFGSVSPSQGLSPACVAKVGYYEGGGNRCGAHSG